LSRLVPSDLSLGNLVPERFVDIIHPTDLVEANDGVGSGAEWPGMTKVRDTRFGLEEMGQSACRYGHSPIVRRSKLWRD
jgi:hypothetical protein